MDKLENIKLQNRIRAKKFYELNKSKVLAKMKAKYVSRKPVVEEVVEKIIEEVVPAIVEVPEVVSTVVRRKYKLKVRVSLLEKFKIGISDMKQSSQEAYFNQFKMLQKVVNILNLEKEIRENLKGVLRKIDNAKTDNGADYAFNSKSTLHRLLMKIAIILNLEKSQMDILTDIIAGDNWRYQQLVDAKKDKNIFPTFQYVLDKVKDKFGVESRHYLIIKLYESLTVRDDFYLKIINTEPDDIDHNYLVMLPDSYTIIINKYKTSVGRESVRYDIDKSNELFELLQNYIKKNEKNEYLFGRRDNQSNFISVLLKDANINTLGEGAINFLRKIRASHNDNTDVKGVIALAKQMGHLPITAHNVYNRQIETV